MCSNRFRPASHKYSIRNRVFMVTKCSWKNILNLIMFAQIAKQIIHKQLRQMRPLILSEYNLTLFTGASRSSRGRRMATSWGHNKEGNSPSRKRQRLSWSTVPGYLLQDIFAGWLLLTNYLILLIFVEKMMRPILIG